MFLAYLSFDVLPHHKEMIFLTVYCLIGVGGRPNYIKDVYTIGESIPDFPILGFANILKLLVVYEKIKIRKDF